jgi:hypothetical protein
MTQKTFRFLAVLLFAAGLGLSCLYWVQTGSGVSAQPATPQNPPTQAGGPFDTGGRDDKPAGEVFKNIQSFKNLPAARLGMVMNTWTRVLGVKCNHCHTVGQWDKDEKPQKQIARDMVAMVGQINSTSLKNVKNLSSERPSVSCYTCHRGQVKPETSVPPPPAPAARPN